MALGERGRNPLMARSTAEGAASLRAAGALEPGPAVRCPDDMAAGFLGGFNVTTLAKRRLTRSLYLRLANRMLPGAYAYETTRCNFIDEVMLGETDAGLDELVLLGAGLDSRPYRLAYRLQGLRVFKVDHPASQATQRARLRRVLDEEPRGVRFVPVDFTRDDLAIELARAGHDEGAAALSCGPAWPPTPRRPSKRSLPGSAARTDRHRRRPRVLHRILTASRNERTWEHLDSPQETDAARRLIAAGLIERCGAALQATPRCDATFRLYRSLGAAAPQRALRPLTPRDQTTDTNMSKALTSQCPPTEVHRARTLGAGPRPFHNRR